MKIANFISKSCSAIEILIIMSMLCDSQGPDGPPGPPGPPGTIEPGIKEPTFYSSQKEDIGTIKVSTHDVAALL